MYGRYGSDQLSLFLCAVYIVLLLLSSILGITLISTVALALLLYSLFRSMSRNFERRRAENAAFLKLAGPGISWLKMRRTIHRDKAHRYFKCPNCNQYLRVPKGKGKITINCRSCGVRFEQKS